MKTDVTVNTTASVNESALQRLSHKIRPAFTVSLLKLIYYICHFVTNVLTCAYHLPILCMSMVMISHSKYSLQNFFEA